jgi:hypothetical protein
MPSRVVVPEDTRLSLSNGDWISIKKRLNAGENKRMVKRGSTMTDFGLRVDTIDAGTAKVVAYLLDWSLTGLDQKVIPILEKPDSTKEAALDLIDPDSYTEILRAIEAHEVAMRLAREAEKNVQDGAKTSSAISPSPVAADGPTTTSSNSTKTSTT